MITPSEKSLLKPGILFLFLTILFFSCNRNPLKVDISDIKTNIEVVRFDQELFALPFQDTLNEIADLSNEYPDFFDLFTYRIIRIGGMGESDFPNLLSKFVHDTMIVDVKNLVDQEFSDFDKIEKELNTAFKYFQFYYPQKDLPVFYFYISGFNQSAVIAENLVGVSLDKYLGRNCSYYQKLSTTPQYKVQNMYKEKIVPDVVYAWGMTEFGESSKATNVLGNMIEQGKYMYFTDALLPSMHDTLKIGYNAKQLEFCLNNEAQMWNYLVENKMLFSNKRMDIVRYINDSPTTSGFPLESPGRAGIWIGWQIVRQYMKKHPKVTLPELMENNNYQQILNDSEYFPE